MRRLPDECKWRSDVELWTIAGTSYRIVVRNRLFFATEDVLFCTTVGLPVVSLLNYLIHCGLGFSDDFVLMC